MKNVVSYLIGIFFLSIAFAQENTSIAIKDTVLQNLERAYNTSENDSVKFLNLLKLSQYESQRGLNIASLHIEEALELFNSQLYQLDTIHLGDLYRSYGSTNRIQGNFTKALELFHKAKDIYTIQDKKVRLAVIYQDISILYYNTEDYHKSIEFGKLAIKTNKKAKIQNPLGILRNLGFYHNNIGLSYLALKQTDSAMYHYEKAKDYFDKSNYEIGWYRAKSSIAEIFESQGELKQSLSIYQEKLDSQIKGNFQQGMANSYVDISRVQMKLKAYIEALKYIDKAIVIAKKEHLIEMLVKAYLQKSEIYKSMNRYKEAYKYIELHHTYNDSIINIDNVKKVQEIQLTYDFRKEKVKDSLQLVKEREIAETKTELAQKKSKIKSQWLLFGGIGLLAIFTIIYLLRSQKFTKQQKKLQEVFSQELINEQEKERSRLARDLHDSVGQKLMLLSKQTKKTGNENMENLANSTLEEIRSISRGLHPSNLESLGITTAINALIHDLNENTDLFFTEEVENVDNLLSKESELHLYRIIQESLSNIVKHSEAKAVKLHIEREKETVKVFINDNGKGFDIASKQRSLSLGLKTLFERARIINAYIDLQSNLGKGTILTLSIPIRNG